MIICETKQELRTFRKSCRGTVGFVPTMGYLHDGHAKLLETSIQQNDVTILSIFVNPTQFGPNEDLDRYPRDFERDHQLAASLGVDCIFYPSVDEMYTTESTITFDSGDMANVLCGASRPGHFNGVLQVVTKLFHLVQPTNAYFGQKDAQQLALIESLVEAYDFPLSIVRVATIRDNDGLAKSSRNVYLSAAEREQAPRIYQALVAGKKVYEECASVKETVHYVQQELGKLTAARIDYVDMLSYPHLKKTEHAKLYVLAVAVFFEKARLIDNILIERVNPYATNDVK
ncbi:pantoate--beta-alanine ligase [Chryseomicrobium excrementi]|uniref:Pantothenate synthetase n=1 Tax=Chryseomicrobium excrementi TaxID=2041346 RepID=A0A2M9F2R4_9BACL|nr:pantoate--beta-alanine ligase [Chryseomicrobium excrementi]PJK17749.1 pantoate--beta-alanine ligase [Chryseomicrobium excrementi]